MGAYLNAYFNGAKRKAAFPTEVKIYNESLTTSLSTLELNRLSRFVNRIKSGWGVSDLSEVADGIYIRSGETQESSLKNLVDPTQDSTSVNDPIWTKDEGFYMNGSSQYLRVGLTPSTMTRYSLNDAGFAIYTRSRPNSEVRAFAGSLETVGKFNQIVPAYNTEFTIAVNGTSHVAENYTFDKGMYAAFRDDSTNTRGYINSIKKIIGTNSAVSLIDKEFYEGARNLNNSPGAYYEGFISFSYYGKTLTESEYLVMLRAYELYQREKSKGILSLAEINTTKNQIIEKIIYEEGVDFTNIAGNVDARFRTAYIAKTSNNVIMAGSMAKYGGITDYYQGDLVVKYSYDYGNTWDVGRKVVENNKVYTNTLAHGSRVQAPGFLRNGNRIYLFCTKLDDETYEVYWGQDLNDILFQSYFGYVYTDDDGETWSDFVTLNPLYTAQTNAYFSGPGNGIVMADGTLVMPYCDYRFSDNDSESGTDWGIRAGLCYSTNNGDTWQVSSLLPAFTDESKCVEYDGKLYLISRTNADYCRVYWTDDMGDTWNLDTLRDKSIGLDRSQFSLWAYKSKYLFISPQGDLRSDLRMRITDDLYDFHNVYQFAPQGQQTYGYSGVDTDDDNNIYAVTEKTVNIAFWNMSVIKNEI